MASQKDTGRDYSRVIRFCMDCQGVLKAVEMYTTEHLASVDAAVRCLNSFRTLIIDDELVDIAVSSNSLQIGPTFIPEKIIEKTPAFSRLYKVFATRQIARISIRPDVAADDILSMAHTLTTPFEPKIAERQYDELENKSRYRIRITGKDQANQDTGQHLLPHILSGRSETELTEASKELLYLEITRNIEETGRLLQKQLKRETNPTSPIQTRDVINARCDRWVHLLGELLEAIHSGEDTISVERQRQVLEMILPYLSTTPYHERTEEFDAFLDKLEASELHTKIRLFAEYYDKIFQRVNELSTYRLRVENFLKKISIEALQNITKSEIKDLQKELESLCPGAVNFQLLYRKLLHAVISTTQAALIHTILVQTVHGYLQTTYTDKDVSDLTEKVSDYCKKFPNQCQDTLEHILIHLINAPESGHPEKLVTIFTTNIDLFCNSCHQIKECSLLKPLASGIQNDSVNNKLKKPLVDAWKQLAHSLLHQDFNAFRTSVTPMAENDLAPDRFDEDDLQDYVADLWKSFARSEYFQTLFKRLTDPDRETRFSTIDHLSHYGSFAVWLSLGGLDSENWQLRRNLATIIGRVASLNTPAFLKQVLRDRDWHVRFEVISALRRRVEEVADQLKNETNHPLGRLITLALLDGRKEIREETYAILESLTPVSAVRNLISTYKRLSGVSDDYEVQERVRIINLLGVLSQLPESDQSSIIKFLTDVATMKEGFLTPQWMIPIKKAAVECLGKIGSDESREWLEKIAHKRPYRRGIGGREARSLLKKLKN